MDDSILESELHISPKLVLTALVAVGCLISLGAELFSFPWDTVNQTISLVLLLSILAIIGWLLFDWKPLVGRWFTILSLIIAVHLGGIWLNLSGSLAWAVIPTALAVSLVGIPAAAITAVAESAIVFILAHHPVMGGYDPSSASTILVAIWIVFVALFAASYKVRQHAEWLTNYHAHVQRILKESLDQRVELVQTLDDLAHANRQLALMNKRVTELRVIAEEAQKVKTRFVARVSHEFRTPLNMIIGLVDLLTEKPEIYDATLSPRMRDALRIVHRNSQHLSDMVNDVLDLIRIETDRMVLHRERVAIKEIIDVVVEEVRPLLESKKLALRLAISENIPEFYGDRTRIEQVVLNLVSNATRYTEKGQIAIVANQLDQYVRVSVADTGQGISPNDLDRIFEPFSQGTSDFWRDKGGSGLGLSISKQFIEMHSGRIWVESELGVGTTFTFELPISPPIDPICRPGHQIQESWIWHERHSKPKFPDSFYSPRLIVCDETGDLYTMLARCSSEVEFVEARGDTEAIELLRQTPAQAILLNVGALKDLQLRIKTFRQESKGTPIIGCSVPGSRKEDRSLGLLGRLMKPVTRHDLVRALRELDRPIKRILLVDDNTDEVELLSQMLRVCDGSLEIMTAYNGEEALDRLRCDPPDLMLLDLVMPGIDGQQVLETMAYDEEIPIVPTFFVTAKDPVDQPPRSSFLLVTMEDGLSLNQLLRCSLELSNLLLQPESSPDPMHE